MWKYVKTYESIGELEIRKVGRHWQTRLNGGEAQKCDDVNGRYWNKIADSSMKMNNGSKVAILQHGDYHGRVETIIGSRNGTSGRRGIT